MPQSMDKLDAADALYAQRELEKVAAKIYEERRPEFMAFECFPITDELHPADKTFVWQELGFIGEAKIIASGATDLPMVDAFIRENHARVAMVGEGFRYTTDDVRAMQKTGRSAMELKSRSAKRASDYKTNRIAWFGDRQSHIPGFLSAKNVTRVSPAAAAASPNGTGWNASSGKTAEEILVDIGNLVEAPFRATQGVEAADTVVISSDEYSYISTTRVNAGYNSDTILKAAKDIHPQIEFKKVSELNDVPANLLPVPGSAAANVAASYRRSDDVLRMELPLMWTQRGPQEHGLSFMVPCEAKTAGVIVHRPLAVATMQGI
jgi:hypothetical protein